jgi:N-acetylmuramoyl-L-alanine amidase
MRRIRKRVVIWMNPLGGVKLALSALILAMMVYMFTYELPSTQTWTHWTMPLSGKVIALDAGHGGPDGGAESKEGLIEKDINLAISLYLRDYLQQAGAVVFMTREEDTDLADEDTKGYSKRKTEDLIARVDMITKRKAQLAVSIHLNSIPQQQWKGAQTFYYPSNKDNQGLANLIQDELRRNLTTDRVAKTAPNSVYILRALKIPSALVEVGFLSNPEEARLMGTPKYQQRVAAAIYQGILRYYSGEKISPQS